MQRRKDHNTCKFTIYDNKSVGFSWTLYAGNGVPMARSWSKYHTRWQAKRATSIISWIFDWAIVELTE